MSDTIDFKEFHRKLNHSPNLGPVKDTKTLIKSMANYCIDNVRSLNNSEFQFLRGYAKGQSNQKRKEDTIQGLKSLEEDLVSCIEDFSKGNLTKSYNYLLDILFPLDRNTASVNIVKVDVGHSFYRMRTTDKYAIFSREDMFNIPFDLLELQNYARFNALGYSCLYLANSLYISWEEMRRPDISKVNFAHFKNQKQMNLLDLTIPLKITKRKDFLTIFLTLLCTVEVSNDEKSYKYEYVIPNLVIGSLISAYFDSRRLSLDGIRYISSKRFESEKLEFDNQTQLMYDYVFPPLDYEQKGHSNHLKHLFKLSKGRSLFLYNAHQICFRKKTTFTTNYKDSLFYELENYVKKEKLDFIRE